ncbi:MAG TPA: HAD hydrolase family protein, partial [Pseudonocardiaceae bacterium]|nr:HAD hydrolase family protein [Pseudonocardiaceae bacterium]
SCKTAGLAQLLNRTYREPTLTRLIAFGDGGNDACLLRTAGVGIAMAAADPGAAIGATHQLTDSLAQYLNSGLKTELTPRPAARCPHRS